VLAQLLESDLLVRQVGLAGKGFGHLISLFLTVLR
jgi:hypothetical protein